MAIDLKTLTDRLIRSGFPRRGAGGAAQAILDAVGTPSGGGGGGGGGIVGATRADAWGIASMNGQARSGDGFDLTTLGGGAGAGVTVGAPYILGSASNAVDLIVAAAGWYEVKLYIDLQFSAGNVPEVVNAGIDYPNEGSYFPTWQFPVPATSRRVKTFAGTTGAIKLAAGDALTLSAGWSGAFGLQGGQFAADVIRLS